MPSDKKFYITTPIYYVNARPHIGHAYSTIVADVIARRHRLLGEDVYFLTGTDEHGQKIERSAAAAGIPPQQFADEVSASFQSLWKRMGITNDDFIRTTEARHKQGVQKLFATLQANNAIYLDTYTGQYCVSDEAYVEVGPGEPCPDCGRITETISESNYYFKLSDYQDKLVELIESDTLKIQPPQRKNEILSFICGTPPAEPAIFERSDVVFPELTDPVDQRALTTGFPVIKTSPKGRPYFAGALRDLSISRTSFKWGIPVPGDEAHVIYVWLDALANYMTAVGYGSDDPADIAKFEKYWPADLHLVGKEIIRFHSVYWPAFLMAANLPLPKSIIANGWLLFEESKMSKSRGNVVRTETILDAFGSLCPATPPALARNALMTTEDVLLKGTASAVPQTHGADAALAAEVPSSAESPQPPTKQQQDLFAADILRYFLLREVPFGQDGSFSFDALVQRYNSDLANGYGNLVSRVLTMVHQNTIGIVPDGLPPYVEEEEWDEFMWLGHASQNDSQPDEWTSADNDRSSAPPPQSTMYSVIRQCSRVILLPDALTMGEAPSYGIVSNAFAAEVQLLIKFTDGYLSAKAPWKLAKISSQQASQELAVVLWTAAESIRIITALLYPILPYATSKVWSQLGLGDIESAARNGELKDLQWGGLKPGTKLGPLSPIFPRAHKELIQQMADIEAANAAAPPSSPNQSTFIDEASPTAAEDHDSTHPAAAPRTGSLPGENAGTHVAGSAALTTERPGTPPHSEAPASAPFANAAAASAIPDTPQIAIDDFVKIDLRVAKIIVAERIPKADKLLRLEVDLGYEKRQILSGIAEWYQPEELVGRVIAIVANLAPRKMRGLESHGMLLAASHGENGKPVLATFGEEIALGSRLR